MSEKKKINVKCPTCKNQFEFYSSEFRPFCNERCQAVDMGRWFEETYAIPGQSGSVYIEDSEVMENLLEEADENN